MCNYETTSFTLCGCAVSQQTGFCGYQDDDFSECMNQTQINEVSMKAICGRPEGQCSRNGTPTNEEEPEAWENHVRSTCVESN